MTHLEHDETKTLLGFLIDQPEIYAAFGSALWGEMDQPPADAYNPTLGPCVCFKVRGGQDDASDALKHVSWQFKIYGSSDYVARQAYYTFCDAIFNRGNHDVLRMERETVGTVLREPVTGWPFVLVHFKTTLVM